MSVTRWLDVVSDWRWPAGLAAAVVAVLVWTVRYDAAWTDLQRADWPAYRWTVLDRLVPFRGEATYDLMTVAGPHSAALATADTAWVVSVRGQWVWRPSDAAKSTGADRVERRAWILNPAQVQATLAATVYAGQSPVGLLTPALAAGVLAAFAVVLFGGFRDAAVGRGRRLRGAELVTPRALTRRLKGDGLTLQLAPRRIDRLLGREPDLRLPRALESQHLLIVGDVGSGRDLAVRQILDQIAARGERAIVCDPALAYVPSAYDEARGDVLLNPLDARCPFWTPADELQQPADRLTLARSLCPDRPTKPDPDIASGVARRILAHLLTARPDPHDLGQWLSDSKALTTRLEHALEGEHPEDIGFEHWRGVQSILHLVADALLLLPAESDTTARWSATDWAWRGQGWVFLTCPPPLRPRLRPMLRLWLDLLAWRLTDGGADGAPRTWFVLDEAASLDRLPALQAIVGDSLSARTPTVCCVTGRSVMESRARAQADALLSQPATKIVLRTSDPTAAAWISRCLGSVELERLVPTASSHGWGSTTARVVEPIVCDSALMGYPSGRGVVKVGEIVAPFVLADLPLRVKARKFIARPTAPWPPPPAPAAPEPPRPAPEPQVLLG